MPSNITKSDIDYSGFRVWKSVDREGVTHWYISRTYTISTVEGETWQRRRVDEAKAGLKTRASGLFTAIRDYDLGLEGLDG